MGVLILHKHSPGTFFVKLWSMKSLLATSSFGPVVEVTGAQRHSERRAPEDRVVRAVARIWQRKRLDVRFCDGGAARCDSP